MSEPTYEEREALARLMRSRLRSESLFIRLALEELAVLYESPWLTAKLKVFRKRAAFTFNDATDVLVENVDELLKEDLKPPPKTKSKQRETKG